MEKQAASFEVLVFLVITAALVVFAIALGVVMNASSESAADQSCFSAVIVRSLGGTVSPGLQTPLASCKTRVSEFTTEPDRRVRDTMSNDLLWCLNSFRPTGNFQEVTVGTNRFCHVCAIYYDEQARTVDGVWERTQALRGAASPELSPEELSALNVDPSTPQVTGGFNLEEPIAILYVQDRVEVFNGFWHQRITGGQSGVRGAVAGGVATAGGVAVGVWLWPATVAVGTAVTVGGVLTAGGTIAGGGLGFLAGTFAGPQTDGFSGILITPYDQQTFDNMGCTRFD